jgi:hypothetical protein
MQKFAGIGSRQTPVAVQRDMEQIAFELGKRKWLLRSGHAPGADQAFERGYVKAGGRPEVYLPWNGFEGSESPKSMITEAGCELAASLHPNWDACSWGARRLLIRNGYQILGYMLNDPVQVIIYWQGRKGGTEQALRVADWWEAQGNPHIDRYNLKNDADLDAVIEQLLSGQQLASRPDVRNFYKHQGTEVNLI